MGMAILFGFISIIGVVYLVYWFAKNKNTKRSLDESVSDEELKPIRFNNESDNAKPKVSKDIEICNNIFIAIRTLDFFGKYSVSNSGEYIICWSDGNFESAMAGNNTMINGRCVLLKNQNIILTKDLKKPSFCVVANNGAFIVNDFANENIPGLDYVLNGIVSIFDSEGSLIIEKKYNAILNYNYIAPDGSYAIAQTCNANNEDGNCLILFDLSAKREILKTKNHYGWNNNYIIDSQNRVIYQIFENGKKYPIYFDLSDFVEEEYLLNRIDIQPNSAYAYKNIGEYYESKNANMKAIEFYEKALSIDSKVGVKRKLDALKKKASAL